MKNFNRKDTVVAFALMIFAVLLNIANHHFYPILGILGFDFATSVIPGWHTLIFPPFIVVMRVFSTLTVLQALSIFIFIFIKKQKVITEKSIEYVNIVLLLLGGLSSLNYLFELFTTWYSGYIYEQFAFYNRVFGAYWWSYLLLLMVGIFLPLLFLFHKIRQSIWATLAIAVFWNINNCVDNIAIKEAAKERDYQPSSWTYDSTFNFFDILISLAITFLICFFVFFIAHKTKK